MLAESEVDVHNLNGAMQDTEVESKDTLSNLSFGFQAQTQLPSHTLILEEWMGVIQSARGRGGKVQLL